MKHSILLLAAALAFSAPAFAGRGAGGAHSQDSSNLSRFNERQDDDVKPQEAEELNEKAPAASKNYKIETEGYVVQETIQPSHKPAQYNVRN